MDFPVAPPVRAALLEAIDREDVGYLPADLGELTRAAAAFLAATQGWEVAPSRIFPVADVLIGIRGALDALDPTSGPVVLPTPAYPPFFEVLERAGRPVVPVP